MASWEPMSLKHAGVVLIDCVHATPNPTASGYPYIAIPQMTGGRIDFDDARQISAEDLATWTRKARPRKHDVVLSRRTNPGVIAPVSDRTDFALGQNLVLLRADGSHVLPEFLRWLATSPQWWAQIEKFMNVGAIFNSLRCGDVPNFVLPIPPLADQRNIAGILSALDDKIELNRRMNETLEASARALFRDWFVDFGPTRAKTEGRPAYLVPDLWSIFPDRLGDDGVPTEWSHVPLTDLFDILGGGTPKTSRADFWDGDVPWFSVVDTPAVGSVFVLDTDKTITMAGVAGSAAKLIEPGTTIISARGTVGNLAIAAQPMTFNQSCYALRGKGPVGQVFVYLAADNMVATLKSHSHGSVFSTITRGTFEGITMPRPDGGLLARFEIAASPLLDRIKANVIESRTLAATRDALLPKLMSGTIHVRDAQTMVGAHL